MHSACLLIHRGRRLLLDAGETWAGKLARLRPDWILITHAHPDHAFGIAAWSKCPVYVSPTSERLLLAHYPGVDFRRFRTGESFRLGPFAILPYRVVHSLRAPAVGFRISAGGTTIAYNPDLIFIPAARRILTGVDVYIGDGASLVRPLVRRHGNRLFGHTTVRAQLHWCAKYKIPRAVIVHCGKQLVEMDPQALDRYVGALAGDTVRALVGRDGQIIRVTRPRTRVSAKRT